MPNTQDFQNGHNQAQKTLELMQSHRVPATPRYFEIWLAYASGANHELIATLDKHLADRTEFTSHLSEVIFNEHLSDSNISDSMMKVGDRMQDQLHTLMESVQEVMKDTSAYGSTLQLASDQLSAVDDMDSVSALVDTLVKATRQMAERSRTLESRLEQSTQEVSELRTNLEYVRHQSLTDQLTGLPNRKAFDAELRRGVYEAAREGKKLCLLFADIDHFKRFNDTWGHQTGDNVLRLVAHSLKKGVKGQDTAARYGGEEFAVILPNTSLNGALTVAEHIRELVESKELKKRSTGEKLGHITISIGCLLYRSGENLAELIYRADSCLYAAKHAGRNRVVSEIDPASNHVESLKKGAA